MGLAAAAVTLALAGAAEAAPAAGEPAPDFLGTWHNGSGSSLSALKGKVVLVEFMRTW
jgi:hypothetical protein